MSPAVQYYSTPVPCNQDIVLCWLSYTIRRHTYSRLRKDVEPTGLQYAFLLRDGQKLLQSANGLLESNHPIHYLVTFHGQQNRERITYKVEWTPRRR